MITVKDFKNFKPTPEMIESAELVFKAMLIVEYVTPIVYAYKAKVLAEMKIISIIDGEPITDPRRADAIEMGDAKYREYLKKCRIERDKSGLGVRNKYSCPLLDAVNVLRTAEEALIDATFPITQVTAKNACKAGYDKYYKLVELLLLLMSKYVDKEKIATV
jgi:hypothetical protein